VGAQVGVDVLHVELAVPGPVESRLRNYYCGR
jgi:hypothetical protein